MSQIDQTGSSRKVALSPGTSWYRLFFAVMLVMAMVATVNQVAVTDAQAQVVTSEQIGSGTLDSSKATAPRFERVFFDALATGPNTIRVLWDSNADVIFTLNDATTGERLATHSDVVDPGNFTIDLVEGTAYFLGVSSRAGALTTPPPSKPTPDPRRPAAAPSSDKEPSTKPPQWPPVGSALTSTDSLPVHTRSALSGTQTPISRSR